MLIGLNGFLGSGKDTVYERISALVYERQVERVSFADKLKISAAAAFGVTQEYLEQKTYLGEPSHMTNDPIAWMNQIKDEGKIVIHTGAGVVYSFTGRQYLQWYGTESHRDVFGDNFWVDQALPLNFDHDNKIVCVTDVRFPNEIDRVKELGGKIWNIKGIDDSMAGTHASEIPIPDEDVDVYIANNIRDDYYRYLDNQIERALGLPRTNSILR